MDAARTRHEGWRGFDLLPARFDALLCRVARRSVELAAAPADPELHLRPLPVDRTCAQRCVRWANRVRTRAWVVLPVCAALDSFIFGGNDRHRTRQCGRGGF